MPDNPQGKIILICDHYFQVPLKLYPATGLWKPVKRMFINENWKTNWFDTWDLKFSINFFLEAKVTGQLK